MSCSRTNGGSTTPCRRKLTPDLASATALRPVTGTVAGMETTHLHETGTSELDLLEETRTVLTDLSWLDSCTCGDRPVQEFFVAAGHTLSPDTLRAARSCPVRRQEVIFAYGRDLRWGYFGALSPGQRSKMTLPEALAFIAADTGR